jgi:hypothetical protein
MDVILDDIKDSAGLSYFGQKFAPGRWAQYNHARISPGDRLHQTLGPQEVNIPVKYAGVFDNEPTNVFLGGEALNFANTHVTAVGTQDWLNSCNRGLWPASNITGGYFTRAVERPPDGGAGYHMAIGEQAFSYLGREVGLYIVTWNKATNDWNAETQAELVWYGRIRDSIRQDGKNGRWVLSCDNVMKALDKKIMVSPSESYLSGFNFEGDWGRECDIRLYDKTNGNLLVEKLAFELVTAGWYETIWDLRKEVADQFASLGWWSSNNVSLSCHIGLNGAAAITGFNADTYTKVLTISPRGTDNMIHPLQALGFDGWKVFWFDIPQHNIYGQGVAQWSGKYYTSYHPMHQRCNGGFVYVDDGPGLYPAEALWDDQGDDRGGTGDADAQACAMVEDAVYDARIGDSAGRYLLRYTAKPAGFSGYHSAKVTLGEDPLPIDDIYGFCGTEFADDETPVKQIYLPRFKRDGGNGIGLAPRGPFELLLYPLLSTGGQTGYNHDKYDACPLALSVGIPAALVDIQSFLDADKSIMNSPLAYRDVYVIDEGKAWSELVQLEGKLFGYAVVWRRGKMRLRPVLSQITQDEWTVTIDESARKGADFPTAAMLRQTVVNQYHLKITYNNTKDKWGRPYTLTDADSASNIETRRISIEHPGVRNNKSLLKNIEKILKAELIGRLTRFPLVSVDVSLHPRLENRVFAGDVVKYTTTCNFDIRGDGTRSMTTYATVTRVDWDYQTHTGNATLLLHDLDMGQPWSPSALVNVAAANGGWNSTANAFTLINHHYGWAATDPADGAALANASGWKLRVTERAPTLPSSVDTYAVTVADSLFNSQTGLLYVQPTTLAGWDATKQHVITFDDYGDAAATQIEDSAGDAHGSWQANTTTELLNASAQADRWG